jgi:hypothetical protein
MITRAFKTGFGGCGCVYLADCYKAWLIGFDDVVLKALAKEAEHHESIDGVFYINVQELYGNKQVPGETFSSPEHQTWLKERGLQSPVDPQPIKLEADNAALRKALDAGIMERAAQLIAHRACCGTEHDPANGKFHGYCVVCGVPWPCEYAGKPLATPQLAEPKEEGAGGVGPLVRGIGRW